uniref:WH1 domain-containing protein n=1 Tax=Ditylenchus dipsaci TaxID=166011 RepID=A0A915CMZ3_9BILA
MRDDSMANGGVGESLLACATADVMLYEDTSKQWIRPDDPSAANSGAPNAQKLSNVQLIQDNSAKAVGFRIVAVRICDRKLLINQNIFPKLKYQAATTSFHQWRNEHRQVYGLSFSSEQDAGNSQVSNDYHHGHIPQQAQQPQQQHYSTASMNGDSGGTVFTKTLITTNNNSLLAVTTMMVTRRALAQAMAIHNITNNLSILLHINNSRVTESPATKSDLLKCRKSPQLSGQRQHPETSLPGSNNSSNSSQPGQNIYASANMLATATPTFSTSTLLDMLKLSTRTSSTSSTRPVPLRKVSNGVGNGQPAASLNRTSSSSGDNGIGSNNNSKTSTISSTNSGHSDLLKAASSSSTNCNGAEAVAEKKVNGETNSVLRPWQKTTTASIAVNAASSIANNNNASVDSPRVHRK